MQISLSKLHCAWGCSTKKKRKLPLALQWIKRILFNNGASRGPPFSACGPSAHKTRGERYRAGWIHVCLLSLWRQHCLRNKKSVKRDQSWQKTSEASLRVLSVYFEHDDMLLLCHHVRSNNGSQDIPPLCVSL